MHLLLTGGTGFIGTALRASLGARGHTVTILTRQQRVDSEGVRHVRSLDEIPAEATIDAVVNLAGASLAGKRWNAAYKETLRQSRLATTHAVIELCDRLATTPEVLVNASAVGWYGPQGDEPLDEESEAGTGFSAELCRDWEAAAGRAGDLGMRVCIARFGVVFDAGEGAFEELVRPFRFGIANWLGTGRQWLSWVHRADVVAALDYLLHDDGLAGVFNVTAPEPVTNRQLCAALKRRFHTLPAMPVPAPVMRLMLGEVADELLLTGQRVLPQRLAAAGFAFTYPDIDACLDAILGEGQRDRAA
jgi:uncharacterized protein (TIGR01777 family)